MRNGDVFMEKTFLKGLLLTEQLIDDIAAEVSRYMGKNMKLKQKYV